MTILIVAVCFAIALILLCAGLLGYAVARTRTAVEDPTPDSAASEDLSEEELQHLGAIHHGCFDSYIDLSPACAMCTPVLDAWWARRKATA